jgi:hypothetical protein
LGRQLSELILRLVVILPQQKETRVQGLTLPEQE